jgi:dolichol-phosphate mannosyltransferase
MKIPEISVIVPIYNEALNVEELNKRLTSVLDATGQPYELILVDDGSHDDSWQRMMAMGGSRVCVKLSRNFGHQIAVTAGLDRARGKAIVIIDADLQDPPELIDQMLQKHREGFHVVYARRRARIGEGWFKRTSAKAFYRILDRLTQIRIPLDTGDFRLIDRMVVDQLRQMPEATKFLRGQIAWLGLRQTAVWYDRDPRTNGSSGYTFKKMLDLALAGITGFSDQPLRMVSRLGFGISVVSGILIAYALYQHFVSEATITGWTSLILSVAFFGGIQLLSLGILGEYIARIHSNVLRRPLYVVQEEHATP